MEYSLNRHTYIYIYTYAYANTCQYVYTQTCYFRDCDVRELLALSETFFHFRAMLVKGLR